MVSVIPKPHLWCTRKCNYFLILAPDTFGNICVCVLPPKLYRNVYSWNMFRDPFPWQRWMTRSTPPTHGTNPTTRRSRPTLFVEGKFLGSVEWETPSLCREWKWKGEWRGSPLVGDTCKGRATFSTFPHDAPKGRMRRKERTPITASNKPKKK